MAQKDISRRDFLKVMGVGTTATAAALCGCTTEKAKEAKTTPETVPSEGMTYRTTPTTGDKVSILGYGCMRWPKLPEPAKDGNVIDQDAVNELVDYAIKHGVNLFDTSPIYVQGWSEKSTGIALKRHPREKFYISTKLSNMHNYSREASLEMYHNSFTNLQVDYIDYYLLHSVGGGDGMGLLRKRYFDNGILDFLLEERKKGKIRNLGFSYHGDVKVFDYMLSLHDEIKWDFVLIQMNYLDWQHAKANNPSNTNAEYLYGELAKRGIPVMIMEPLLGGRLAKVPDHIVARLKQREPEKSVASWAFRFCGTYENVLTVLSGMAYMEHLQDNIRTYSPLKPLTEEELQFLKETADLMIQYPTIPCTDCKYCMPCPYGIDIPGILWHYNKCLNEGYIVNEGNKEYRDARKAFLVGYDRSVPKLRQANHCIGCEKCIPLCPQRINIPQKLHLIDDYVESLKRNG
jgi:predicted aldo/keto reductase-like oxidoreductase